MDDQEVDRFYEFDDFLVDAQQRSLMHDGKVVSLSRKLFDLLLLFVRSNGRILSKDEIVMAVWPGTEVVTDENVAQNVSRLRKILRGGRVGQRYIEPKTGIGYRFTAQVRPVREQATIAPPSEIVAARREHLTLSNIISARRIVVGSAILLLVLTIVVAVMFTLRHLAPPQRVSFGGNKLLAYDENDRVVWEHEFSRRPLEPAYERVRNARFADINNDGKQEILVVRGFSVESSTDLAGDELFCFSSTGKLLWSYEPEAKLSFAGQSFEGPWHIADLLVSDNGNSKTVWLAVTHHTWWPSFVVKLYPRGDGALHFVSSGAIYGLGYLQNDTGSFVLACGVNNEYKSGSLAVLRDNQESATSPQGQASQFTCDACPEGRPYRYFIFPRSELNVQFGREYNVVRDVRVFENHIDIATREVDPDAQLLYRLSKNLDVETVSMTDGYVEMHRREQQKLGHALEACPALSRPYLVRVWDAQNGWVEKTVPWALSQNR